MRPDAAILILFAALLSPGVAHRAVAADAPPLPGTAKLEIEGDIASQLVDGVDRFLLGETDRSIERRDKLWHRDFSSPEKYAASVEPNRRRLAHILGVRDERAPLDASEPLELNGSPPIHSEREYRVYAARWPAFGDVWAEGLELLPNADLLPNKAPIADVIVIPDADQTPEMLAGIARAEQSIARESQFARRLAESGCRVLVPTLVSRDVQQHGRAKLTNREFIYRSAFELGRHVIGYEIEKALAGVDRLAKTRSAAGRKIGVIGYGEGGMLALYAAALDPRIDAACVSGYFDSRQNLWQEPLDRNVFGLLEQFGDAEIASLVAPRRLVIEAARGPQFVIPPGSGGAPGRLLTPKLDDVRRETLRARQFVRGLRPAASASAPDAERDQSIDLFVSGDGGGPPGSSAALQGFLAALSPPAAASPSPDATVAPPAAAPPGSADAPPGRVPDPRSRQTLAVHELDRHNQQLLLESADVRKKYFAKLDTSSLEKFQQTIEPYREQFYNDVIGRFDTPLAPFNARSRKVYDEPKYTGYEVVLDVFPDVIAYGILLAPKDVKPGERRPVVVCQHGLSGRPQDVVRGGPKIYAEFASKLADEGFVTFSPQNLYIFNDRFRTLQRKANPLGKTLFSIIVPQHQQIVDWLATLPFVDKDRIAFYGLSYGGKTAMRVPPLVKQYCLSICSGDFNEWVWKNASTASPYSYVNTGEYEIFEFDLGSTFNYAEMAALIAPRPFMVERGHFDVVAPDEMVAYEFAKVRYLYEAKLGIGDRCRLEWFVGPHQIHGVGTFEFLREKLRGPSQQ